MAEKTFLFNKIIPFDTLSTANLLPLVILKKVQVFLRKTHLFILENPIFERFPKAYNFSSILRLNLLQFGEKKITLSSVHILPMLA